MFNLFNNFVVVIFTFLRNIWIFVRFAFQKRETFLYPEEAVKVPARYRGRVVLTRDPDNSERQIGYDMSSDILLGTTRAYVRQESSKKRKGMTAKNTQLKHTSSTTKNANQIISLGNLNDCDVQAVNIDMALFSGLYEESSPSKALQYVPDFEVADFSKESLVYYKEHLLIAGGGKYPNSLNAKP